MIPQTESYLDNEFFFEEQPSRTYHMDFDKLNVRGFTDNQRAMVQLIYKILNTERYKYYIYSWNYGVEFLDLYGEPISFVLPEIKRRVTEALLQDDRILSVENFEFNVAQKTVHVTFTVNTVFGNFEFKQGVNI